MPFSRRSFLSVTGLSTLGISAAVTRAWGQPAAPAGGVCGRRLSRPGSRRSSRKWSASSHGNFARVREICREAAGAMRARRWTGDSATGRRASTRPRTSATSRSPTSC